MTYLNTQEQLNDILIEALFHNRFNSKKAQAAIDQGADVNFTYEGGETLLQVAVNRSDYWICKFLLKNNAIMTQDTLNLIHEKIAELEYQAKYQERLDRDEYADVLSSVADDWKDVLSKHVTQENCRNKISEDEKYINIPANFVEYDCSSYYNLTAH